MTDLFGFALPAGWQWPDRMIYGPRTVLVTPNGREVLVSKDAPDRYRVQPHNDNYWIEVDSLRAAIRAYEGKDR